MLEFVKEIACPSCGGTIQKRNPASKTIGCPYCGQILHIAGDQPEKAGTAHLLIDYGSAIHIGDRVTIGQITCTVLGRVRFRYKDGFWDEWFLTDDRNETWWLQEDDGAFQLFTYWGEQPKHALSDFPVGQSFQIPGINQPVFIASKAEALVEGVEGEAPAAIYPGARADYVEGYSEGRVVSMELYDQASHVFTGTPVDFETGIVINKP